MTLKGHYALCFKTRASFGAHNENLNENRLHYQRRRCSPMTLDSDSIRFVLYSRGFAGEGASNNSGVIENVDFRAFGRYVFGNLGNEVTINFYIVLFSPLSPFHWPQNTLPRIANLRSIFTITNSVSAIRLHIYRIELFIVVGYDVTSTDVRKQIVKKWSAEYCGSAKGLQIFRRRKVAGATSSEP